MIRLLFVTLALALAALATATKFTTQRFDVSIQIQRDGTLHVREEIAVRFTEPQRGLIRKLPFITRGSNNRVRRVAYSLVGVTQNQGSGFVAATAKPETVGGDWQVRIGQRDVFLRGPVTYRIDYRVRGAMTPFNDVPGGRTELLWNVLPTHWATEIPRGEVSVTFPSPAKGLLRARVLAGALGTRQGLELEPGRKVGNRDVISADLTRSELKARLVRPLHPGQTVTIVLTLPGKTVVAPKPQIATRTRPVGGGESVESPFETRYETPQEPPPYAAYETELALLPLLALIPLYWARKKRGFREGPLVTQFDPPAGVGPSECGLILDRSVDPRDIVAGMLSLAQKGAATVRPDPFNPKAFALVLGSLTRAKDLTDFEETLYRVLEPYGPLIVPGCLRGQFGTDYRRLSAALEIAVQRQGLTREMTAWTSMVGGLFTVLTLGLGIALATLVGLAPLINSVLVVVIGWILVSLTSNLTAEGARVRAHVRGLREFIRRANADELRRMSETMPAQVLYERLLPFALAFGYVQQWVKAFDGLQIAPPEWFEDPGATSDFWTFYAVNQLFEDHHVWSEAVSPPPPEPTTWSSGPTSTYDTGSSFSSGDSGFGSSFSSSSDSGGGFGSSYDSSSSSFDSGSSSGDGGGGGGGDSW